MIRVSVYHAERDETVSDKEMSSQDALFDLVGRLSCSTVVTFVGFGYLIQLDWEDGDCDRFCVSYFGEKDDTDFLLLERVTKDFALVTRQCSGDVREELRHEFRALAESFIRAW